MQNLKKTAMEYFMVREKYQDLSARYVALKQKVPTEAEKLETAKKLISIKQLETEKKRLEGMLQAYGIYVGGKGAGRKKEAER